MSDLPSESGSPSQGEQLQDSQARTQTSTQASTSDPEAPCPYATPVPKDPCYLYNMVIREEWPDTKTEKEQRTNRRDAAEIDDDIKEKEQELWDKRSEIDQLLMVEPETVPTYDVDLDRLSSERDELQKELLTLVAERNESRPLKVEPPLTKQREFVIVKRIPRDYKEKLSASKEILDELREELQLHLADWHETHTKHENAKKELLEYSKELEKLAVEKRKRKAAHEAADRKLDEKTEAWNTYRRKSGHSKKMSWKGFKRGLKYLRRATPKQEYDNAVSKEESTKSRFNAAKAAHDELAQGGHREMKTKESDLRKESCRLLLTIRKKIKEIEGQERSVLTMRNTLTSGGEPIQIVAGAQGDWWTPWRLNQSSWEANKNDAGDWETKGPKQDDDTPTITVELDKDTPPKDPDVALRTYCEDHDHPLLAMYESQGEDRIAPKKRTELEFDAWQFKQFEDEAENVERMRFAGFRISLVMAKTFFRIWAWVMSGRPAKRYYYLRSVSCGFYQVGTNEDGTPKQGRTHGEVSQAKILSKDIEVFPADSWQFTIKSNAFMGVGYEHEQKVEKADKPQAESGILEYQSSGSEKEETTSDTYTSKSMWGTQSTTTTTSDITGSGGVSKNIHETTTTTRDGNRVDSTTTATGTHGGQAYSGTSTQSATQDFSGNTSSKSRTVDEHGSLGSRGSDPDNPPQDFVSQPGQKLSRAPSMPGSFFPMCPVDISFFRNGVEDTVTQNIKNTAGTIIYLVRKTSDVISRVANIVPAMGWKFGYQADFFAGTLSYFNQFREHTDRRVYMYRKGTLDVKIVSLKVYLFGGFWVDFIIGEIKLGAEININGSIGIKGLIENTHPDADNSVNIGFGPTGSIGCGGEIMLVIGSPDFCKAAGGVATSISAEGMMWLKHSDGPHFDYDIKFDGVKFYVLATFSLIGSWQKTWKVSKERTLKKGRLPEAFDDKDLDDQSAEMDRHFKEDATAAKKREIKLRLDEDKTPEARTAERMAKRKATRDAEEDE